MISCLVPGKSKIFLTVWGRSVTCNNVQPRSPGRRDTSQIGTKYKNSLSFLTIRVFERNIKLEKKFPTIHCNKAFLSERVQEFIVWSFFGQKVRQRKKVVVDCKSCFEGTPSDSILECVLLFRIKLQTLAFSRICLCY